VQKCSAGSNMCLFEHGTAHKSVYMCYSLPHFNLEVAGHSVLERARSLVTHLSRSSLRWDCCKDDSAYHPR
jgi:hypothetical protein